MFKRTIGTMLISAMVMSAPVLGAEQATNISLEYRPDIKIVIDGKLAGFKDSNDKSMYPLMYEGTTYLPIGPIAKVMGKSASWDDTTQTIKLSGNVEAKLTAPVKETVETKMVEAQLRPDIKVFIDDKEETFMDATGKYIYPIMYNNTTYVSVGVVSNMMGKPSGWNRETATVYLGKRGDIFSGTMGTPLKNEFFEYTVNSVTSMPTIEDAVPEVDGNNFIVVDVTIKNIFQESIPMYCDDFQLKWGESAAETCSPYSKTFDDQIEDEFTLDVDESTRGMLIFEAPSNIKDLLVEYIEVYDDSSVGNTYQVAVKVK